MDNSLIVIRVVVCCFSSLGWLTDLSRQVLVSPELAPKRNAYRHFLPCYPIAKFAKLALAHPWFALPKDNKLAGFAELRGCSHVESGALS